MPLTIIKSVDHSAGNYLARSFHWKLSGLGSTVNCSKLLSIFTVPVSCVKHTQANYNFMQVLFRQSSVSNLIY